LKETLYLNDNALSGEVPEELYSLSGLTKLNLSNNTNVSGTLSSRIGQLLNLEELIAMNTTMAGNLPEELFTLAELRKLDLSFGQWSGSLSESVTGLTNLESAVLHSNSFSGIIPNDFALLSSLRELLVVFFVVRFSCTALTGYSYFSFFYSTLETLELHENDFTGSVPVELCDRRGDGFFDLKVLTVDEDDVTCDCCTPVDGPS
jgi:hypothetical protein